MVGCVFAVIAMYKKSDRRQVQEIERLTVVVESQSDTIRKQRNGISYLVSHIPFDDLAPDIRLRLEDAIRDDG